MQLHIIPSRRGFAKRSNPGHPSFVWPGCPLFSLCLRVSNSAVFQILLSPREAQHSRAGICGLN